MDSRDVQKQLLTKNVSLSQQHKKSALRYRIARLVIRARIAKNLTQKELAEKLQTKQPAIARIENGSMLPSLDFLEKMSYALGTELIDPNFAFLKEPQVTMTTSTQNVLKDFIIVEVPIRASLNTQVHGDIRKEKTHA